MFVGCRVEEAEGECEEEEVERSSNAFKDEEEEVLTGGAAKEDNKDMFEVVVNEKRGQMKLISG